MLTKKVSVMTVLKSYGRAEHTMGVKNLIRVWKTEMGTLQGDKAWSRGSKSELFEFLQNSDHYH